MAAWKRFTAAQLAAFPTIETSFSRLGRRRRWRDVKKVGKHNGEQIRWSLIRPTRQVLVERKQAGRWIAIEPVSIGTVIEPTERAALAAHQRGDHFVSLLLFHAVLEAILRANQKHSCREKDTFGGLIHAYERWLKGLRRTSRSGQLMARPTKVQIRTILAKLRALNDLRNDMLHVRLWMDGIERTNRYIGTKRYSAWVEMLSDLFRYGGLGGHLRL